MTLHNVSSKCSLLFVFKVLKLKKINLKNNFQVKISELKLSVFVAKHDLSFKVDGTIASFNKVSLCRFGRCRCY